MEGRGETGHYDTYRKVGTVAPLLSVGLTNAIFGAKSIGNIVFGLLFIVISVFLKDDMGGAEKTFDFCV